MPDGPMRDSKIVNLERGLNDLRRSLNAQAEMVVELRAAHAQTLAVVKRLLGPRADDDLATVLASMDLSRRG